nr:unnamed protein product [Digitaria exilis]
MERAGGRSAFHVAGPGGMSVHGYVAQKRQMILNYVFGCSHSTVNFPSGGVFAGIAAINPAPASLTMQLAERGMTWFSYCLTGGPSRHGFLRFGADVPHNPRYQTTRILPALDANDSAAYYVGLIGISIGMCRLNMIHPEVFARGKGGQGGTIIDLGTPVTVMAEEAYQVIEQAAWSALKEHGAERVARCPYNLCVRVTKVVKGHLPSLSLHFADEEDATLVVSPEQLFLMMDDEHVGQMACLAMVPGRRTVIGALQQVDTRFVFDLKDSKILFAPESCIKDTVSDI